MAELQGCKVLWSVKGSHRDFFLVYSYVKAMPGCNAVITIKGKKKQDLPQEQEPVNKFHPASPVSIMPLTP